MSSSYDSNGNLTGISSDATYSYSWDAEGKPVSITRSGSTVNLTYDALGRMVEQNRGGSYTQIVYSPGGAKLALMNGSTLQQAFVPLPAGAQAVYNGSGLAYYRRGDWLGSSRLASTPSRTLYYDGALCAVRRVVFRDEERPTATSRDRIRIRIQGGQLTVWRELCAGEAS